MPNESAITPTKVRMEQEERRNGETEKRRNGETEDSHEVISLFLCSFSITLDLCLPPFFLFNPVIGRPDLFVYFPPEMTMNPTKPPALRQRRRCAHRRCSKSQIPA